ncbi:MAG: hypothetical protein ACRDJU_12885, partial [Actinomycetota bacterium]
QEERTEADLAARSAAVEAVVSEARTQLEHLVGPKQLAKLRTAMGDANQRMAALREPPGGLKRDRALAARARREHMDAVLAKLDVDPQRLRDLGVQTRDAV